MVGSLTVFPTISAQLTSSIETSQNCIKGFPDLLLCVTVFETTMRIDSLLGHAVGVDHVARDLRLSHVVITGRSLKFVAFQDSTTRQPYPTVLL